MTDPTMNAASVVDKELEQSPRKSKKWSNVMVFMILSKAIEVYAIHKGVSDAILQQMIFWEGVIETTYVGGTAALEMVVKGIFHYKNGGKSEVLSAPPETL